MTYTLHQLASGSYDLALDGVIVGGVVRETTAGGPLPDGARNCWTIFRLRHVPAPSIASSIDSRRWRRQRRGLATRKSSAALLPLSCW